MTREYKGFTLYRCYCGYPKMAWSIFWGYTWKASAITLKEAKAKVNDIIAKDKQWHDERNKALRRIKKNIGI